ncbi:uroporphyrinogen-III synthase [Cellulomonas alba]|uniref:Uroporphyrinogen-III synthase n=1 Tax=Cellulomonas alba TaxID=3053467 RepID=A0ABT7SFG4_9CELL|nr:uroporphyrinogen-III synthase [Cellulomonas alba]MDM7854930.1 uroporphyrinogen-III synthase [Cellulomonas alba]
MRVPRTPLSQPALTAWADRVARGEIDPAASPIAGWPVLVPRPSGASSPAVAALAAVGAEPLVVPLIETVPPDDPTELDDLLLALGSGWYGWLVVTSAAAVPVLVDRAAEVGQPLAELVADGRVHVAAVGPGTERALRAAGVAVDLVPAGASSAAALLDAWPAPEPERPTHVLFPRGDLAAATLADGLRARGWDVDDVVAYRTVPAAAPPDDVRTAWSDGTVRAALLTSASTVRALVDALGAPPPGTLLVAIGPSTAREAERLGLPLAAVATEQTMAGLVDALVGAAAHAIPTPPPVTEETP